MATTTTNTTNSRTASRSPVTLKIKFKSATIDQFIERYSVDISHGGIFIRTKDPLPVGTALRFEFQLKDASPLITGDGTVVWTREFDANRSGVAPGMGVRFDRLPSESQEVLEQILAHKASKHGKPDEEIDQSAAFTETPTRVAKVDQVEAFGDVPTRVTPAHVLKGLQQKGPSVEEARRTIMGIGPLGKKENKDDVTPLPRPLPFHNDLDEFPDEAFEEATKVAALEALAKQQAEREEAQKSRGPAPSQAPAPSMDDEITTHRTKAPTNGAGAAAAVGAAAFAASGSAAAADTSEDEVTDREQPAEQEARRAEQRERDEDDAFSRNDADSDLGSGDVVAAAPSMSTARPMAAAMAEARREEAEEAEERDGGSSLGWIAAAAVLLVLGGIGGFMLLRNKDDKAPEADRTKPAAKQEEKAPVAAPTPTPVPTPTPTPTPTAVPDGVEMVVAGPAGSSVELVGESQSGPAPMTFKGLEKGKTYKAVVSSPGFVSKEISFEAGGAAPAAVALDAKPIVLRVTSDPPGAQIFVDGRRQPKLTPADVKLSKTTAAQKSLTISVRRAGFVNADEAVTLEGLTEDGDQMVREVAVTLTKRAPAVRPPVVKPPVEKPAETPAEKPAETPAEKPASDKPAEKPASDKPAEKPAEKPAGTDKPASKPAGAEKPAKPDGEPTPDWMNPK